MKKTILRRFFRGHLFCLHAKFQVSYSTPSRFVKKMTYFCIIFAEKYFPAKYLRFYTSTKNFIKIRPKMSKRQPIKKKTFFYLLPLLTYCAMVSHLCKVSSAFSSSPYFRCFLNSPQGLKELHSYNVPFDYDRDTILKEVSTQHRRRVCRGPAEARVLTLMQRELLDSRGGWIMSTSSVSAHEKLEFLI